MRIANGIDGSFGDWGGLRAGRCSGPLSRQLLRPYSGRSWRDIFSVGGAEYRQVLHAVIIQFIAGGYVNPTVSIKEAEGSIGNQQQQFEEYLERLSSCQTAQ
jgi:hypothetical protein